jgi:hypothetical protein
VPRSSSYFHRIVEAKTVTTDRITNSQICSARFRQAACICVGLFASAVMARAQDQAAQIETQQDIANRNQPDFQQPLQLQVTDRELGEIDIVSRKPRPKMFTFSTIQSFNYTSNAFLVRNGEQDAFFWNGVFDVSFVPYATSNFTPRLTYEQNFFRYNRFSRLDFDSNSLDLDLRYDLNRSGSWFIDGSVDIGRLYSPRSSADAFYKFGYLDGSITNVRPLGQTSIYLASTAGINWRVGNPSAFDRIDPYLNLALTYSPIENVFVGAFLRPEVRFYTNDPIKSSRTDFDLLVGANVSWTPVKYLALGATVSFTDNFSNSGPAEYDVVTPGLVLSARIAF